MYVFGFTFDDKSDENLILSMLEIVKVKCAIVFIMEKSSFSIFLCKLLLKRLLKNQNNMVGLLLYSTINIVS